MEHALDGSQNDAVEFHGWDGLGNVHNLASEFTASQEWIRLFEAEGIDSEQNNQKNTDDRKLGFIPSKTPSYLKILEVLRDNDPDTVTICAIGPLMNIARAAEIDPVTFSRVKQVVTMGGALLEPGNVTPVAEFNVFSDPIAAARVYSLTSPSPKITLPLDTPQSVLDAYSASVSSSTISVTLLPLDITHRHQLTEDVFSSKLTPFIKDQSPLARWINIWMTSTFDASRSLNSPHQSAVLYMHDPLAVWFAITDQSEWNIDKGIDIRVETKGEWTRGSLVFDRRGRSKSDDNKPLHNDRGLWLLKYGGNCINVCVDSPGSGEVFANELLNLIFN